MSKSIVFALVGEQNSGVAPHFVGLLGRQTELCLELGLGGPILPGVCCSFGELVPDRVGADVGVELPVAQHPLDGLGTSGHATPDLGSAEPFILEPDGFCAAPPAGAAPEGGVHNRSTTWLGKVEHH